MTPAQQRLDNFGLRVMPNGDHYDIMSVKFGSKADKAGVELGYTITSLELDSGRPAKEWIYLPVLAVFALVVVAQRRRLAAAAPAGLPAQSLG